ncbi:MAG: hypothetical protein EXS25_01420 [Pedosphaera sp.]|nr:hypothetical protein [Pedosphaera sp.]
MKLTPPIIAPTEPNLRPAYWFALLNALSSQVILSGPMVLFAKTLGASTTILGLVAGMMPLLTILQIPAANFVDRIGYRWFVIGGWSLRISFIFFDGTHTSDRTVSNAKRTVDPSSHFPFFIQPLSRNFGLCLASLDYRTCPSGITRALLGYRSSLF